MNKYGPNFTKLIAKFIPVRAIPSGGGFAAGLHFFTNADYRQQVLTAAEHDAIEAVRLIKTAPDNPYGDDDESIAKAILEELERRAADAIKIKQDKLES